MYRVPLFFPFDNGVLYAVLVSRLNIAIIDTIFLTDRGWKIPRKIKGEDKMAETSFGCSRRGNNVSRLEHPGSHRPMLYELRITTRIYLNIYFKETEYMYIEK